MAIDDASARWQPARQRWPSLVLAALFAVSSGCPPVPPATVCASDSDCPRGHCDPAGHFCYLDPITHAGGDGGAIDSATDRDGSARDSVREGGPGDTASSDGSVFDVTTDANHGDAACSTFAPVVQLACGNSSTCALSLAGQIKCWGGNANGELGLGDTIKRGDSAGEMGCRLPAVDLGNHRATAIAGGFNHFCAIVDDGTVRCWGYNLYGQLGLGDTRNRGDQPGQMGDALPAVDLGAATGVVEVATGAQHTCARFADGAIKCWGRNHVGQLGIGDTKSRGDDAIEAPCDAGSGADGAVSCEMGSALPFVDVGVDGGVTGLVAGAYHSCVVLADTHIKCWGYNNSGQLGLEDVANRGDGPGEMGANLPTVHVYESMAVATRNAFNCALLATGQVRCWGYNGNGQLGVGDTTNRGGVAGDMEPMPNVDLQTSGTVTHVAVGNNHACAVLGGRTIKCWGWNYEGQLGLGDTVARGNQPNELGPALPTVALGVDQPVRQISIGGSHGCVLFEGDAGVRCWGYNVYGQLGLGDAEHRGDDPNEMGLRLPAVDLGVP